MSKGRGNFSLGSDDESYASDIVPITQEVLSAYPSDAALPKQKKKFTFSGLKATLPKRRPTLDSRRKYQQKSLLNIAVLLLLVIGAVSIMFSKMHKTKTTKPSTVATANPATKAEFKPLVPKDVVGKLDGNNVRYDDSKKLVSVSDKLDTANIVLSQQKLPKEQASDPATLIKIAGNLKGAQPFQTDKGSAFLSVDTEKKTGQTVVFLNKDVLVFARTDSMQLTAIDWQKYINSLAVAN